MKEPVYTMTDWYDGPRKGVANFEGTPHYYECPWYAGIDTGSGELPGHYLLTPLDAETFRLALEDWAIWERWEAAFAAGMTTQDTHPVLPEDRPRHDEIEQLLLSKLVTNPLTCRRAKGAFSYEENKRFVKWAIVL
ncbi:hypothetical protein I2I05_21380 [Hymenobacter sp. BT683]|uniref:Uncharacterized protein n=1 Tax=Hymenobacter jeongseonensis TaxID=2791027 RepID=A0ABS0INL5_9BACT|nr:hypothetical protein [Hymenobacter jeongseonensis]MBF9239958.1 hypothetical protein [Hymenobacter jeongseonensis]